MQHRPTIQEGRRAVGEGLQQASAFRRPGGKIHVAAQQGRGRAREHLEAAARLALAGPGLPGMGAGLGVQAADGVDLGLALGQRVVLQVCGHHPQGAELRPRHHLQQHPLHARHAGVHGPGQQVAPDLPHRQAREDRVAELLAAAPAVRQIGRRRVDRRVAGKQGRQFRHLVAPVVAGQAGEVHRHFLQADDVEFAHAAHIARHAPEVDPTVHAPAPLDVPGQQPHGYFPLVPMLSG
jgi:hypothetical protein